MSDALKQLKQIQVSAAKKIANLAKVQTIAEYGSLAAELEIELLGKKSELAQILQNIQKITDPKEKKEVGAKANQLKEELQTKLDSTKTKTLQSLWNQQQKAEILDPSRPGFPVEMPTSHVVSQTLEKIEDIFTSMGFGVEYSNEVDNAKNTFDSLNIPEFHPARDNWDTLWLSDGNLAIPHTSSMQNRIIRANELPFGKVILGKCFRNEATDARHEHSFTQFEGIYLAPKSNMGEMIGVLLEFFENFFGRKLKYKFTPDFFPFVEPGGQLAIECLICEGKGCKVCKQSGYLEVLGCGMIHPNVIKAGGKDPTRCQGFAWGCGVERIILIEQQINDIRNFYANHPKFLAQF